MESQESLAVEKGGRRMCQRTRCDNRRCYIVGFEDEGRVPEDKEFTQSLEAAKDK